MPKKYPHDFVVTERRLHPKATGRQVSAELRSQDANIHGFSFFTANSHGCRRSASGSGLLFHLLEYRIRFLKSPRLKRWIRGN